MKPARFDYACPETLAEAVALLARHKGAAKPMAGGQSLMPLMAFRLARPDVVIDMKRVPGLDRIEIGAYSGGVSVAGQPDARGVKLGAKVRWVDIANDKALAAAQPLLAEGIRHVAHYQIRNRGTVGGSIAHADPAAEMPGIAVTCDARLHVTGASGSRTIEASGFFLGPLQTTLGPDELITHIELPAWPSQRRWAFLEFARRRGDFALAGIALFYDQGKDGRAANAHVGVIGMGDRPRRLPKTEAAINGRLIDDAAITAVATAAAAEVEPSGDIHASPEYRRALVGTLTERALRKAAG